MAGKGDKPRNCFTQNFKDNYDSINWGKKPEDKERKIGNKSKMSDGQKNTNNYQNFYAR